LDSEANKSLLGANLSSIEEQGKLLLDCYTKISEDEMNVLSRKHQNLSRELDLQGM